MKLATTTGDFNGCGISNQFEAVDCVQKAGFKYIDYNFGNDYRHNSGVFSGNWQEYIKELKKFADSKGVKFVQSHAPMGQPFAEGEEGKEFIDVNKRCIEACALLGIDNTVIHSGHKKGISSKEESFEKNKAFYEKLLPTAEKYGVYLLTENFNKMFDPDWFWVDNAAELLELVKYIDHPMLKVCWDAGHGNMQETPQNEALEILGDYVHALHIQDNWSFDDHHIAPFFGTLNLDSLMHGLKAIDYKGYFTFEADAMFMPAYKRRPFPEDTRLLNVPLELRIKGENLLYEIGKHILTAYDCFEE